MTVLRKRSLKWWSTAAIVATLTGCEGSADKNEPVEVQHQALTAGAIPTQLMVQPVILVPQGEGDASPADLTFLRDHLDWAQAHYRDMLKGRDTFQIGGAPVVIKDPVRPAAFWEGDPATVSPVLNALLLQNFKDSSGTPYNRYNNPYIFAVAAKNVNGGSWGGSMNGGVASGGGAVLLKGWWSGRTTDAHQSALQHELAHTFGLTHSFQSSFPNPSDVGCDSYCTSWPTPLVCRFSGTQGWSITSYNNGCLDTKGMDQTSPTDPRYNRAIFLPDEIAVLSLNKRAFPNLYFDPESDLLPGTTRVYRMGDNPNALQIDPIQIGVDSKGRQVWTTYKAEPPLPKVTTSSGETDNSRVVNIARHYVGWSPVRALSIRKSNPTVGWDPNNMWRSAASADGWVSAQVEFPIDVSLNKIAVHTQHSGSVGAADTVKVEAGNSSYAFVKQQATAIDDEVSFTTTTAKKWRFSFHSSAGNNGDVVVRGLQFFTTDGEVFGSFYPTEQANYPQVTTTSGEAAGSKAVYAVTGWSTPANDAATGFQPTKMWQSGQSADGWVSLDVTFPSPVTLNGFEVHSQYGGQTHMAQYAQILYERDGQFLSLTQGATNGPDATFSFPEKKARRFRVKLYSSTKYVVVRKLLFKSPVNNGYLERPDCITGPQILPTFPKDEFNGDGKADILWYNDGTGQTHIWHMDNANRLDPQQVGIVVDPSLGWKVVGTNDFNLDGKADILWHNAGTGETHIWYMNDTVRLDAKAIPTVPAGIGWRIVGTNDFNGDGKPDILWHNDTTGETHVWRMDHATLIQPILALDSSLNLPASSGWQVVGTSDFDLDGKPDILWHNDSTGQTRVWYMDNTSRLATRDLEYVLAARGGEHLVAINDFNKDGNADLLWHNDATGTNTYWYMNNVTRLGVQALSSSLNVPASSGWRIVSRH